MKHNKAFKVVLNPKFKTPSKQHAWINKQLRLIYPEYYHFEFSVNKLSVTINMFGQTWENGEMIRYKNSIVSLKNDIV